MQDAWLAAAECVARYVDDEAIKGKIITAVKNRLIDICYKKKHISTVNLDDSNLDIPDTDDMERSIFEIKDQLNDDDKKVFDMLLKGATTKEIADSMGWNIRTVYKHYNTIKAKIRS